ncbi:glycerophosphodiester phosphodiesterase [Bacillus sonorensis]|uniref:Glycerophosphodiester phosphodiesterase n=2 Tax=Bacillus sonorensis TaxID=119858 RepID=M5P5V0_9BACI|nr:MULTISPECIES: glycerophosphodiester phosphodiesterase [Bacillus]TWK76050.1 Glycerophosphodiester phosphodiesterase [Bacillus paralicheniformis]ASB88519.1 Glycerophosphodiester phosphodiesterase [Bacillus sonorensis]EME74794.1 glycerophosphodiester phosphodiesterase [Bacillus sonorensis L12]MCZ0071835.1 glycerophosphodiester phosphodiesterase [Bacillus sonorensis]MCZ0090455.1 glycerophosphodiester phosphodiesterase [Bacillus sonorensis]
MTKVFAHRGASGTYPENTMTAFEHAAQAGADGIELDVQMTRDGRLVVIHDEKLDRTTSLKGYIKDFTYEEIKQGDASYRFSEKTGFVTVPTLEEVFDWAVKGSFLINVELKNSIVRYEGMEEKVMALISEYKLEDRIIISSFNHESLAYCRRLNPDIELAALYMDVLYKPEQYIDMIPATGFHPYLRSMSAETIANAHRNNKTVRPFTVNREEDMKKLMEAGVDGFFTDFPEKAMKLKESIL